MLIRHVAYFTEEQLIALEQRQKELGLPSINELLRRIVDNWRGANP